MMSEHEHVRNDFPLWRAKIDHAFKELKAADNDRDARLHHNQKAVERIRRNVFPPVVEQFTKDAREYGFQAVFGPQPNGKQRLTLQGPSSLVITFWTEATSESAKVMAQGNGKGPTDLLQNKNPEHFQESDLGEYLAAQLQEIKPKRC